MQRINIEILLRKVKRKDNVYIAEIQKVDSDYAVITHGGPVKDPQLKRLVHITTEDGEKAEAVMKELLQQKFDEGYKPIPNGSDIHIPGFKNTLHNPAACVPRLEIEAGYRRLNV